jgi:queuosine precursor transporter
MTSALALLSFLATIPAANWLIQHVGTTCIPNGPCLIPVAPGLLAPSGVLMIGVALVLRDAVHERLGVAWAVFGILLGASGAAFLASEIADLAVYAPLRRRRLYSAVLFSGIAGAVIDSAVFLWLAFGSLNFLAGQVVGKLWASLIALPLLASLSWRRQHGLR